MASSDPLPPEPDARRPGTPARPPETSSDQPATALPGAAADEPPTRASGSACGSDASSASRKVGAVPPPQVEGYELREEIHRGGQGVVYRAVQLGTKREVALKVLLEGPFAGETTRRRFEREVELAASLRHPHIVTILDSGLSFGRYYFAMEYIDGLRVDRYIAQHKLSLPQTLALFERICLAVNFAHQRGVIHRDLKPPNILVDRDGQPHILDFGLAKAVYHPGEETTAPALSLGGQLLGTVAYMSPEQAAGDPEVDVRSDVYSLAVMLYEALVGCKPYSVEGPLAQVLHRIAAEEPRHPRSFGKRCPSGFRIDDELSTILLKGLEKDPRQRYQSAGELARDLRHWLNGEPIEARPASGLYLLRKTLRRYRLQAAMAGGVLLMLVGFLVLLAVLFAAERAARQQADLKTEEARLAVQRRDAALADARGATLLAVQAQQSLRRALAREHVQRGDLALQRSEWSAARDSFWDALEIAAGPTTVWALRRYYARTGNSDNLLLALESHGPSRLAPGGYLAVACPTPQSVWVRDLRSGAVRRWVPTPGPVQHLHVTDTGAVAAGGSGWARAWRRFVDDRPPLPPAIVLHVPENIALDGLFVVGDGEVLLAVTARSVLLAYPDRSAAPVVLRGTVAGIADYSPEQCRLAIPTTAGVEIVQLAGTEARHEVLPSPAEDPPRAVRFDRTGALGVLADDIFVLDDGTTPPSAGATSASVPRGRIAREEMRWVRWAAADAQTLAFDFDQASRSVVLARRNGQVTLIRADTNETQRQFFVDKLTDVRLRPVDDSLDANTAVSPAVLTLDEKGVVAHWHAVPDDQTVRRLLDEAPVDWAAAGDGSVVLLANARSRVVAYAPGRSPELRTVVQPRLLEGVAPFETRADISIALDAAGRRAAIRDGRLLRLYDLHAQAARTEPWIDAETPVPDKVALSSDGEWLAVLSRTPLGDQQRITLQPWAPDADSSRVSAAPSADEDAAEAGAARTSRTPPRNAGVLRHDFVGAAVRDLVFFPGTHALLAARSNGELVLLDADERTTPNSGSDPWLLVSATPAMLAISRSAAYLAVAGEDGTVRLYALSGSGLRLGSPVLRYRFADNPDVTALVFHPRDDTLLVRTRQGRVRLYDPATGEAAAQWDLPPAGRRPLAAWIGDADTLLVSTEQGVYEYRYDRIDALIERGRAYAQQRQIARRVENDEWTAAWTLATTWAENGGDLARVVRTDLAAAALRRPGFELPAAVSSVVAASEPTTMVQLAHAAYAGQRFDLARAWLRSARERLMGVSGSATDGVGPSGDCSMLDATTALRMAECDYLAGDLAAATAGFAHVLALPDLPPALAPTVALERTAALVLDGRVTEARAAAQRIGEARGRRPPADPIIATAARIVARALTGEEQQRPALSAFDDLLTRLDERSLLYRDDGPFFLGELARQRGDAAQALVQYQRCLDLARDTWPANWARYRLAELAARSGATSSQPTGTEKP